MCKNIFASLPDRCNIFASLPDRCNIFAHQCMVWCLTEYFADTSFHNNFAKMDSEGDLHSGVPNFKEIGVRKSGEFFLSPFSIEMFELLTCNSKKKI